MRTRNDTAAGLRQIGAQIAEHARARAAGRRALFADARIPSEGRGQIVGEYDSETRAARREMVARGRASVAAYRADAVMQRSPSYRPSSAAESAWISGLVSTAPHWSPEVMKATVKQAIADGDRALLAALMPLAESFANYKKVYSDSGLAATLFDAREALVTPEMTASAEAADWAKEADQELGALARTLDDDVTATSLDVHIPLNAFPNTLPASLETL